MAWIGMNNGRVISWFSCGAASACATKLAIDLFPDLIVARIEIDNEHADNTRFANDCEKWFDKKILVLRSKRYTNCWDVWEKNKYLNGVYGARCTTELKKKVRREFEVITDRQIFGFTHDEQSRADNFLANNIDVQCRFPLIENKMNKRDCYKMVTNTGILLPEMYRLGYNNANCVGCVKGGMGYWNKIKKDFPEVFEQMQKLERTIGASCIKGHYLDTLLPTQGRHEELTLPDCGSFCGQNDTSWK